MELFVSYSFQSPIVIILLMAKLFFKMGTIFLNLTNHQKTHQIETVHTRKLYKIELFEGEKVFSHKLLCIFGPGLTVQYVESCQSMKRASRSSAMTLH